MDCFGLSQQEIQKIKTVQVSKLHFDYRVLLSSFHLNSHTLGFQPQHKQHHRKVLLSSFHLNGHALGFHIHYQKVEHNLYSIINSTNRKVSSESRFIII